MNERALVRLFEPADAAALGALLSQVFTPAVGALARWKYLENPALPEPLIAVAQASSGELVGCYPLQGRKFLHRGAEVLAVLGADLAVLPDYRTGGELHRRLCEVVEQAALQRGAAFAYGFPNADAYRVSKRWFGLRDWTTLAAWSLRLRRWPRWGSSQEQPPGGADARSEGERWDELGPRHEAAGIRNTEFLAWRFADREKYALRRGSDPRSASYLVLSRHAESGVRESVVVDFAAADPPGLEALLEAEVELQKQAGASHRLVVFCLPDSAMARAARAAGLRRVPERDRKVTVKALAGSFPPLPFHLTLADADDP